MGKKILFLVMALVLMNISILQAQTLSQIGFVVNQAIPDVENIAVIASKMEQQRFEGEARTASLVTKKKFHVFGVMSVGDISKTIYTVQKLKNPAVVIVANSTVLNQKSIKYAAQKFGLKGIPLISTRDKDTAHGAFLCVIKKGDKLEKRLNKIVVSALKITLPPDFEKDCVIDVQ